MILFLRDPSSEFLAPSEFSARNVTVASAATMMINFLYIFNFFPTDFSMLQKSVLRRAVKLLFVTLC